MDTQLVTSDSIEIVGYNIVNLIPLVTSFLESFAFSNSNRRLRNSREFSLKPKIKNVTLVVVS